MKATYTEGQLKARQEAADEAFKIMMSGVDKLVALGFKKKGIVRMVSVHVGRRKPKQLRINWRTLGR